MLDNYFEVKSPEQFKELLLADLKRISIINFWASWAELCRQMDELVYGTGNGENHTITAVTVIRYGAQP